MGYTLLYDIIWYNNKYVYDKIIIYVSFLKRFF